MSLQDVKSPRYHSFSMCGYHMYVVPERSFFLLIFVLVLKGTMLDMRTTIIKVPPRTTINGRVFGFSLVWEGGFKGEGELSLFFSEESQAAGVLYKGVKKKKRTRIRCQHQRYPMTKGEEGRGREEEPGIHVKDGLSVSVSLSFFFPASPLIFASHRASVFFHFSWSMEKGRDPIH